jgi:hypothetical protein
MGKHDVTVFSPYAFTAGQKINISEGPRRGDWEVVGVTDSKVRLRCPVSFREFEWDRFCYMVREDKDVTWPGSSH